MSHELDPERIYIKRHVPEVKEIFLRKKAKEKRDHAKEQSKLVLRDLIVLAGSQARFAALCGVPTHSVWDWVRNGISRRGAVLAARSREFKDLIEPWDLRPDVGGAQISEVAGTKAFREAMLKQLEFEASEEFEAKSPRAALRRLRGE